MAVGTTYPRVMESYHAEHHNAYGNRTKQAMRFLNSGNPAGFERFFADLDGIDSTYGSLEFLAELKKVYPKYDSEILGPTPQGSAK